MCEYCRKSAKTEDVSMVYSYYRKEDGESESHSRVSPVMKKDEFRTCLSQLFLSMKVHAENTFKMTPEEFRSILDSSHGIMTESPMMLEPPPQTMAENPYLYN